jgi:hypothetical protein
MIVLEPSARELVLNLLAEEESWVTVYTGICRVHGEIKKTDSGWLVEDDEDFYDLYYIPGCDAKLMDDLQIHFKEDGNMFI